MIENRNGDKLANLSVYGEISDVTEYVKEMRCYERYHIISKRIQRIRKQ